MSRRTGNRRTGNRRTGNRRTGSRRTGNRRTGNGEKETPISFSCEKIINLCEIFSFFAAPKEFSGRHAPLSCDGSRRLLFLVLKIGARWRCYLC